MNALQIVTNMMYDRNFEKIPTRTLILAWLQLHHDNPGLHPDSWMDPGCGYNGWHVLLADQCQTKFGHVECLWTPSWILQIDRMLNTLDDFHNGESEEVDTLKQFFEDMYDSNLEEAYNCLENLLMFHADSPDEVVPFLFNARDALLRIMQGWSR
jgi:hypothetical protein